MPNQEQEEFNVKAKKMYNKIMDDIAKALIKKDKRYSDGKKDDLDKKVIEESREQFFLDVRDLPKEAFQGIEYFDDRCIIDFEKLITDARELSSSKNLDEESTKLDVGDQMLKLSNDSKALHSNNIRISKKWQAALLLANRYTEYFNPEGKQTETDCLQTMLMLVARIFSDKRRNGETGFTDLATVTYATYEEDMKSKFEIDNFGQFCSFLNVFSQCLSNEYDRIAGKSRGFEESDAIDEKENIKVVEARRVNYDKLSDREKERRMNYGIKTKIKFCQESEKNMNTKSSLVTASFDDTDLLMLQNQSKKFTHIYSTVESFANSFPGQLKARRDRKEEEKKFSKVLHNLVTNTVNKELKNSKYNETDKTCFIEVLTATIEEEWKCQLKEKLCDNYSDDMKFIDDRKFIKECKDIRENLEKNTDAYVKYLARLLKRNNIIYNTNEWCRDGLIDIIVNFLAAVFNKKLSKTIEFNTDTSIIEKFVQHANNKPGNNVKKRSM